MAGGRRGGSSVDESGVGGRQRAAGGAGFGSSEGESGRRRLAYASGQGGAGVGSSGDESGRRPAASKQARGSSHPL